MTGLELMEETKHLLRQLLATGPCGERLVVTDHEVRSDIADLLWYWDNPETVDMPEQGSAVCVECHISRAQDDHECCAPCQAVREMPEVCGLCGFRAPQPGHTACGTCA